MKKVLIAMVLLATVVKLISGSHFDYNKYTFVKLNLQDESGLENDEQGKSKIENEDKIFRHSIVIYFFNPSTQSLKILWQQDVYLGFVKRPNTPPPDAI